MPLGWGNTDASDFEKSFLSEALRSAVRPESEWLRTQNGEGVGASSVDESCKNVHGKGVQTHRPEPQWEARSQRRAFPFQREDESACLPADGSGRVVSGRLVTQAGETGAGCL